MNHRLGATLSPIMRGKFITIQADAGRSVRVTSRAKRRPPPFLAACFLASLSMMSPPNMAAASCIFPEAEILWSYPARDGSDVPTNADLWIASQGAPGQPLLDGVPLVALVPGIGFELGELTPLTTHTITFQGGFDAELDLSFSFTTGAGLAAEAPPAAPDVLQLVRDPSTVFGGAAECQAVLNGQGCFDTGAPLRARFETDSTPLAWLVERSGCDNSTFFEVWPATCGAPLLPLTFQSACARLSAITATGLSPSSEFACIRPDLPPGITLAVSSGCTRDLYADEPTVSPALTVNADAATSGAAPSGEPAVTMTTMGAAPLTSATENPAVTTAPAGNGGCSLSPTRAIPPTLIFLGALAALAMVSARQRRWRRDAS